MLLTLLAFIASSLILEGSGLHYITLPPNEALSVFPSPQKDVNVDFYLISQEDFSGQANITLFSKMTEAFFIPKYPTNITALHIYSRSFSMTATRLLHLQIWIFDKTVCQYSLFIPTVDAFQYNQKILLDDSTYCIFTPFTDKINAKAIFSSRLSVDVYTNNSYPTYLFSFNQPNKEIVVINDPFFFLFSASTGKNISLEIDQEIASGNYPSRCDVEPFSLLTINGFVLQGEAGYPDYQKLKCTEKREYVHTIVLEILIFFFSGFTLGLAGFAIVKYFQLKYFKN